MYYTCTLSAEIIFHRKKYLRDHKYTYITVLNFIRSYNTPHFSVEVAGTRRRAHIIINYRNMCVYIEKALHCRDTYR